MRFMIHSSLLLSSHPVFKVLLNADPISKSLLAAFRLYQYPIFPWTYSWNCTPALTTQACGEYRAWGLYSRSKASFTSKAAEDLWTAFLFLEAAHGKGFHVIFSIFELPAFVQNLYSDGGSKCTTGILYLQKDSVWSTEICTVVLHVQSVLWVKHNSRLIGH